MRLFRKMFTGLKNLWRWYRDPIPGQSIYRVDPVTIVMVIGFFTTAWGLGRAIGIHGGSYLLAESLRDAANNMDHDIVELYNQGRISGVEREAALERIDMLTPVLHQYADIIEAKGNDLAAERYFQSAKELANTLNPGQRAGRLVGLIAYGKGLDQILSIGWSANTIGELELLPRPFSEEEAALRKRIDQALAEISGLSIDELFKARMRIKINYIKNDVAYDASQKPCQGEVDPEQVKEKYRGKVQYWAEHPVRLVGEGEMFADHEAFLNWMVAQALADRETTIIRTWSGSFEMVMTALTTCQACAPPVVSGQIVLKINPETCQVTGTISGVGDGEVTINDCINGEPISATCTSYADMTFSGTVKGQASEGGEITFEPTTISVDYAHGWVSGCDWASRDITTEHWEDPISLGGRVDWQGPATGSFQYASTVCSLDGDWTADLQE